MKRTRERNPFERAISSYFFKTKSTSMEDFDNWLKEKYVGSGMASNFNIYTIKGKIAVDFVGRYEYRFEKSGRPRINYELLITPNHEN